MRFPLFIEKDLQILICCLPCDEIEENKRLIEELNLCFTSNFLAFEVLPDLYDCTNIAFMV